MTAPVSRAAAFRYWLELGFLSFGGPAGQISLMHTELVLRRRWISEGRFLHALNYTMVLPGPEAQQLATYIGWLMHGSLGGIVAGALFVLPSLVILIALAWIYLAFGDLPAIAGLLYGIKPAVTAIVVFAAWRIGSRALQSAPLVLIAAAAFVAIAVAGLPFPLVILLAALAGFAGGRLAPEQFRLGAQGPRHDGRKAAAAHGKAAEAADATNAADTADAADATNAADTTDAADATAALIDDTTPIPPHARYRPRRFAVLVLAGLGIWVAAEGALWLTFGRGGVLPAMGWFFTKAALLTFGGAYAVLPYVYQGAVEQHGWLSAAQMIDGLALGETTPGPLIMVVAFVGFVGAFTAEIFGPGHAVAAGIAGALVATLFTFLPSFLFILVGGPLVERSRGEIRLTAPLTGITAAVVGVILSLGVFFAWHVLWPEASAAAPFAGRFEWFSLLLAGLALLALWRFGLGVVTVIAASAGAGLGYSLLVA